MPSRNFIDGLSRAVSSMFSKEGFAKRFESRSWIYWVSALAFLIGSVLIDQHFEQQPDLLKVRYWIFRQFSTLGWRPVQPRFAKVLLIGDDTYYSSELDYGRQPINRDFLARIVHSLDEANASVIAMDFNLALPKGARGVPGDYADIPAPLRKETNKLVRAIGQVAEHRAIVLPKRIVYGSNTPYALLPDVLDAYGLCVGVDKNDHWLNPGTTEFPLSAKARSNIGCGYINLPTDMRDLPPQIEISDHNRIDSFALAIARRSDPDAVANLKDGRYYGSYISRRTMVKFHALLSASSLLKEDSATLSRVSAHPVIVGGSWHLDGGRGEEVDLHLTPIGELNGAIIHANFLEALLDARSYPFISDSILHSLEVLFGFGTVLVFAGLGGFVEKTVALILLSIVLLVVQYAMLTVLGTFFDAFVPLLGLWIHSLLERLFEYHSP